jgi:hypothetical protein
MMCCGCARFTIAQLACKSFSYCLQVHIYIYLSSLVSNSIGEAGAGELLTALQFNKTLAKLE